MWYGTEGGGLCRDDGYTVKVFRSDFKNPGILENNSVTCITEDVAVIVVIVQLFIVSSASALIS